MTENGPTTHPSNLNRSVSLDCTDADHAERFAAIWHAEGLTAVVAGATVRVTWTALNDLNFGAQVVATAMAVQAAAPAVCIAALDALDALEGAAGPSEPALRFVLNRPGKSGEQE